MKITGFLLREAIRRHELRRDTAVNQFDDSLSKFPGEDKRSPDSITEEFVAAEAAVAKLQAAQSAYNLRVEVDVLGEKMTLCEAVKRLGGAGRIEKMWRTAAGGKKDRYNSYNPDNVRREGETRAERTVSVDAAMHRARKLAAVASALRAEIARGNLRDVDPADIGLNDLKLLTE